MRWTLIIVLYFLGAITTVSTYEDKFVNRFNERPGWFMTIICTGLWPICSPVIVMGDWSKEKDRS